jgi:predicted ATPase/DNA-binding SARP family transcriptional activator
MATSWQSSGVAAPNSPAIEPADISHADGTERVATLTYTVEAGVCRFGVLGPLVLDRNGESVALPGGHQRSLLALFLMAGGVPLPRDRLIDELWGEHPPASAISALHVHLSKLRELLGELVVRDPGGYALRSGEFEVDSWRFDELINDARSDAEHTRALVVDALALVRGDPLADVACEGSIAGWRRALEEKHLQALLLRVDCDLAAGAAAELVAELELLASEHQFEERLWGQLILALYRAGRQADALDTFARARRTFATELGLEPGEQLTRLHGRILEHDPSLLLGNGHAHAAGAPVAHTPARPASNLPRPPTKLVGRQSELAVLQGLFADPDVRLATLVGTGGVGKTRVEIELARRLEPEYRDGAVFVRLERLTDPGLVAAEIATAIGQRDGSEGPGADGLGRYLQSREVLLVLDNFEHLLPAAVLVAELLEQAPNLLVLVSSRAPLRIRGERLFIVQPLSLPDSDGEPAITGSPAVQLFMQSALAANPALDLGSAATRTIAAICTQLDGLPLALELAASRSRLLTLEQILEQLSRPLAIGERGLRDLPARQQTLHATISWSYLLLSEPAREALRAAGAFLDGFTLAALEAVLDRPAIADLDELRESSLVRQRSGERFELLVLVRAFALDALRSAGEEALVRERRCRYFARLVAPAHAELVAGVAFGEAAAPLVADHANLRSAFADAVDRGDGASATEIALGMQTLWLSGNSQQESSEHVAQLLDRFTIAPKDELDLMRMCAALEVPAATWQRRFLDRATELGDVEAIGMATVQLHAEVVGVDRAEMDRLQPGLLDLLNSAASPRVLGWVHAALAGAAYVDGDYASSHEHATACVAKAEEIGYEYMHAVGLHTQLLASSALSHRITQPELAALLGPAQRHGIHSIAVGALLFVARYAVEIDPAAARRFLAHAERIVTEWDAGRSLEGVLGEEAMELLGLTDLGQLVRDTPPLDPAAVLASAADWVNARPADEVSPRALVHAITFDR